MRSTYCYLLFLFSEIRNYFENTYDLDEAIFTAIIGIMNSALHCIANVVIIECAKLFHFHFADEEYFNKCPDRLRLPLIFYLAHTATLYVNKLLLSGLIKVSCDSLECPRGFKKGASSV